MSEQPRPPQPQPGILEISPYVPGESTAGGANRVTKLSSNENPLGPSPKAMEAYRALAGDLALYPPASHADLRTAIAEVHDLEFERIICGAGSDEVISFLCQAYAGPNTDVIYTEHGFSMYRIYALSSGATPVEVAEVERRADIDAILAAVTDRTALIFIANPNNPTGVMLSAADVQRLADGIPRHCLLVLDGAYAEYVEGFDAGAQLVHKHANVVMTRTFSKIYGLGGLRVGWGYADPSVIDVLNRVRGPFNVSAPALAAAEAAVRDQDYVTQCREANATWRDWLAEELSKAGVPSDPAFGNFILARFRDQAEADAVDTHLRENGIVVRKVAGYNLPHCLRITIGDEVACRRVAKLISTYLDGAR